MLTAMNRWFNTAGPCKAANHYMLPPLARLPKIDRLIAQQSYFVIHAPRQIGKTTAMLGLAEQLNASGKYIAVVVSAEVGAAFSQDIGAAEGAILGAWRDTIAVRLPLAQHPPQWQPSQPGQQIRAALQVWAQAAPLPLVVFIDEIDALQDQVLVSILRQLRDGYTNRPHAFPHSLGLIGLRDVRDYKMAAGGSSRLNTSSPFNIKVESFTLRNFNAEEVIDLYQQHTIDTGQVFELAATQLVFDLTQGQPWLVNAIARQLTEEIAPESNMTITPKMVLTAKEILIRRQDTHLDSLAERLREDRVQAIIEPMLAGLDLGNIPNEDIQFVQDLGLCQMDPLGGLVIANSIYREVLPRVLTATPMAAMPQISPSWLTPTGELDVDQLLHSFLDFWLQHGEALLKSAAYPEIAPHLVMMAFLHRVINGGGTLEREYAIGRDRMDLCLRYGSATLGIELKVWRTRCSDPVTKGLEQLESYLQRLSQNSGEVTGWLVIFDRRNNAPALAERLQTQIAQTSQGKTVMIIRA